MNRAFKFALLFGFIFWLAFFALQLISAEQTDSKSIISAALDGLFAGFAGGLIIYIREKYSSNQ